MHVLLFTCICMCIVLPLTVQFWFSHCIISITISNYITLLIGGYPYSMLFLGIFLCMPYVFCMQLTCTITIHVWHNVFFYLGLLPQPQLLGITISNSTLSLSWVAPPSLEVSTPPTISHYILGNNVTNIAKTISNLAVCKPAMPCNSSLDINDPPFIINTGEQNTTILDYNGTIEFTLFAVNGAGDGSATTYTYVPSKKTLTGY